MKKVVHCKEFGNIAFSLVYEVDDGTKYDGDKPVDGFSSYLCLEWVDKYGDLIGHGGMELNIPANKKWLKAVGTFLIELSEKL